MFTIKIHNEGEYMKISDVRIRLVNKDSDKFKASATITIDECFTVHDIKIIEGNNGNLFIVMPSRKIRESEYKDVARPLNTKTRNMINDVVLKAYNELPRD